MKSKSVVLLLKKPAFASLTKTFRSGILNNKVTATFLDSCLLLKEPTFVFTLLFFMLL